MAAIQRFLSIQERENVFFIAGIVLRTFEKHGVKHNVKIFSQGRTALADRVHRTGKHYDERSGTECVSLSPHCHQNLSLDTVNQFKLIVPVQGKRAEILGDDTPINGEGKRGGSMGFGFVQGRVVHKSPPTDPEKL